MESSKTVILKFGFYSTIALTLLTITTFGFAMIAVPPAGPYCPGNCMDYPFRNLLDYYPRDYYWMYLAVFQIFSFVIFVISVHYIAQVDKRIFSTVGIAFAIISTTVLLADYFIQFATVPISMLNGETEGIALITQYNGHGIFIALEELGYITMSIALFFLAFVFPSNNKLEKSIRWILFLPLFLNILTFVLFSIKYGIDRNYRFEVASISIDWIFIIIAGVLISIYFNRLIRKQILKN